MIGNIIEDVANGVALLFQHGFALLLLWANSIFGVNTIGTYTNSFLSGFFGDSTFDISSGNLGVIITTFQRIGIICVFILLFIYMVTISFSTSTGFKEQKDTIKTLFIRAVISLFLVATIPSILIKIWDLYGQFNAEFISKIEWQNPEVNTFESYLKDCAAADEDTINNMSVDTESGTYTANVMGSPIVLPSVGATITGVVVGLLFMIVRIFLIGAICYNYIKLCIEFVNRYIKVVIMFLFAPAACATYTSAETEAIFFTYVKTFATGILSLILTKFFLDFGWRTFTIVPASVINSFALVALFNLAQKLEQFLKELGFSASAAGGSLMDSMMQSMHNLGSLAGFGSGLVTGGGAALMTAGALTNNMTLAKAGSFFMGNGIKNADVFRQMNSNVGNAINRAMHGGNEKVGHGQMGAMDDLFRHSGDRANKDQFLTKFNSMNAADTNDYLSHLVNDAIGAENIKQAMGLSEDAPVSFDNLGIDRSGNLRGTMQTPLGERDFVIGTDAMKGEAATFTDNGGNQMHMAFDSGSTIGNEIAGERGVALSSVVDEGAFESGEIATANPITSIAGFSADEISTIRDMGMAEDAPISYGYDDLVVSSSPNGKAEIGAYIPMTNDDGSAMLDADGNQLQQYQPIMHTSDSGAHYLDAAVCPEFNCGLDDYKENYLGYDPATDSYDLSATPYGRSLRASGITGISDVAHIDRDMGGMGGYKITATKQGEAQNVTVMANASSTKDSSKLTSKNIVHGTTSFSLAKDSVHNFEPEKPKTSPTPSTPMPSPTPSAPKPNSVPSNMKKKIDSANKGKRVTIKKDIINNK